MSARGNECASLKEGREGHIREIDGRGPREESHGRAQASSSPISERWQLTADSLIRMMPQAAPYERQYAANKRGPLAGEIRLFPKGCPTLRAQSGEAGLRRLHRDEALRE